MKNNTSKLYDAVCPYCGKINRNLYLGETGGTMECDNCFEIVKLKRKDLILQTPQPVMVKQLQVAC